MDHKLSKIGIVGGTFDPIHKGHLAMAEAGKKELGLGKVLFIPTGVSYMKEGVTPNSDRYEMTRLALMDYPDFEISDIEIKRDGNTYTCDTVKELKELYPDSVLYFIIGTDTLYMLEKWKDYEYLFHNLIIVVCKRMDDNSKPEEEKAEELKIRYGAEILFIPFEPVDISSTKIRKMYQAGYKDGKLTSCKCISYVSEKVHEYIMQNSIYRTE